MAEAAPGVTRSLARRLAVSLSIAFVSVAAALLALWAWIGHGALEHEHEAASLRLAALFEASLRNAMLARDLEGLERLIDRLGATPGLEDVALLTPAGQVRFAAREARLGAEEGPSLAGMCLSADCGTVSAPRLRWAGSDGAALRVYYPVRNEARCSGCHGLPAARPVNGVLVLDFTPMAGERIVRERAGTQLLPAVLAALLALGVATAWVLRRQVLRPVAVLAAQVARFGRGELEVRSKADGDDELAALARGFDRMADQVCDQIAVSTAQSRFLQALLDATPGPMLLIAADHRIVMANAAYGRLIGRPLAEVVGQPCHRISRGLAEPCPATLVQCPLVECARQAEPLRTVMAFRRADGVEVDVEIDAAPLVTAGGERQVVEAIRRVDEQVRFSQEQRLSAIGLLANGVAHEIHNPLAAIRLALQSSQRGLADGSIGRDELADYLRLVDEQIDRCVGITQRLLRLSLPSAEQAQPVAVADAVSDVLGLLGEEARRAGVRSTVAIEPPAARVLGDESELRQVLVNLVQNAIHAMPGGGTLEIRGRREGLRYRIAVADSGCGIAADVLPLIFLPFYSRRADGQRGSGLGLAICKSLVEARGGKLTVSSRPGKGAVFEIDLPDADAQSASVEAEAA